MVSTSAAGLRAALAIAVFAVLAMSSQGHPRTKPLCSDCQSLCSANCTAFIDASCNSSCSLPAGQCEACHSSVLQSCCQRFCSSSNDTSTVSSCCPSDCISGNCTTCSCQTCTTEVQNNCQWAGCGMHADDRMRCDYCRNGAAQACYTGGQYTSCLSDCNHHCVKQDC